MIVGGGVVLAASYEAKAFGVAHGDGRRGRRGGSARTRSSCRRACRPTPRRARRSTASSSDTSPLVEGLSIDEAFLDVRGLRADRRHADRDRARGCAATVREQVGLPITVGVARTKFLAKVASGVAKPDGLLVVPPERRARVPPPAAGRAALGRRAGRPRAKLHALRDHDRRRGRRAAARRRSSRCSAARPAGTSTRSRTTATRGRCSRAGAAARSARSARSAAARRSPEEVDAALVGARRPRHPPDARRPAASGRTVVLRLRFDDFSRATRSHTLPQATAADAGRSSPTGARAARGRDADRSSARGLTLVGIAVAQPRRRRRRPARAAVRPPRAAARSTPRSTRSASGSARPPSRARCCSAATTGLTVPLLPD